MDTFQVPLIQNAECEVWHERAGITVQLYPEMMCAGYRDGGKDSCKVETEIVFSVEIDNVCLCRGTAAAR